MISPFLRDFCVSIPETRANGNSPFLRPPVNSGLGWGGNKGIFSNLAGATKRYKTPCKMMFRYVFRYLQNDVFLCCFLWVRLILKHLKHVIHLQGQLSNWAGIYTLKVSSILEVLWCNVPSSEHISIQEAVPSKTKPRKKLAMGTRW